MKEGICISSFRVDKCALLFSSRHPCRQRQTFRGTLYRLALKSISAVQPAKPVVVLLILSQCCTLLCEILSRLDCFIVLFSIVYIWDDVIFYVLSRKCNWLSIQLTCLLFVLDTCSSCTYRMLNYL